MNNYNFGDAISRADAIHACLDGWNKGYEEILADIRALPAVTPQSCDDDKLRRQTAIEAAKTVSEYCKSVNECKNGCIFYDKITGYCTFTKYNKYGLHIIPEDWEV